MNKITKKPSLVLITGSFLEGCGVILHDEKTDNLYHLVVLKETGTDRLFVETGGNRFYECDICKKKYGKKFEIKSEIENVLRNMCAGRNYREWSTDMIDKLYPYISRVIEDDLENRDETVDPLAIGRLSVTEDMVITALMMFVYEK